MTEKKNHQVNVLRTKKYVLFINSYILLGSLLTAMLTWHFHVFSIVWTGSVLFILLPIVAKRYLMSRFSEYKTFNFTKDSIIVSSAVQVERGNNPCEIKFEDVASYKYEDRSGNPYLIFYLKNKKKIGFDFEARIANEEFILDIILKYIKDYNRQSIERKSIILRSVFLAANNGSIFLILLGIGWICLCIVLAMRHSKAIPFSIIAGIAMSIQMLVLRRTAMRAYKEHLKI